MKRIVSTTAALSIALSSVTPLPLWAQEVPPQVPCAPQDADCLAHSEAAPAPEVAAEPASQPEVPSAPEPTPEPETPVSQDPVPPAPEPSVDPTPEPAAEASAPEKPPVESAPEPVQPPSAEPVAEPPPQSAAEQAAPPTPEEAAQLKAVEQAAQEAAQQAEDLAKAAAAAPPEPVTAPQVPAEQAQQLQNLITSAEEAAPLAAAQTSAPAAQVVETLITPADARSSAQEFSAAPVVVDQGKKSGLSDLEKAGLLALGALAIGTMMSNGREVVSNSGDRVVLRDDQGGYQIYKDDDTLLRRPGANVRTEQYSDGSSRTTVDRDDGISVITLRDASGRVLRRSQIDAQGREHVLIDDLRPQERVDISRLPKPNPRANFTEENAALTAALARQEARALGRSFSLQQIRDLPALRQLAVTIDVDNITFASGSAVIRPSEAPKLASLGRILQQMLADNPAEVFLVEGHTDAVGSAISNLTLSDRRAESVALALTEYYRIPPENMVVQGYGEAELRIATQADEPRNRRAALRLITPLMEARR